MIRLTPNNTAQRSQSGVNDGFTDQQEPAPVPSAASLQDIDRKLLVFRKIAAPLLAAVSGLSYAHQNDPVSVAQNATQFSELIDSTIQINQEIIKRLGLDNGSEDIRWQAASATAELVAAHFRAASRPLTVGEAAPILEILESSMRERLDDLEVSNISGNTGSYLGKSIKALAPAANSIARFSFGRDASELLGEITERLTSIATAMTARLNGSAGIDMTGTSLYFAVLEVAGEFYMESHLAEMERLLEMPPEERKDYVRAHDRKIPMEPVWEALELRMGMLESMTSHLPFGATDGNKPVDGNAA